MISFMRQLGEVQLPVLQTLVHLQLWKYFLDVINICSQLTVGNHPQ